jgi:hypothetical protein
MLNTNEVNQNAFTALAWTLLVSAYENCKVVAVTAEKNVATVDRLSKLAVPCFCANLIVGTPTSVNSDREVVILSICSASSEDRSWRLIKLAKIGWTNEIDNE